MASSSRCKRFENGIGETTAIAFFEFLPGQFDGGHSLANIDFGQRRHL